MMEVQLLVGSGASGKSTLAESYRQQGYNYLNRDSLKRNAKIIDLLPLMEQSLQQNHNIILDNTFPTIESRAPFIALAKKYQATVKCLVMKTSFEDAQFNVCLRMIRKYGQLIETDHMRKYKDPNLFPISVLYQYRKQYQEPTDLEGFDEIKFQPFVRQWSNDYCNKALILDYDGTLRKTKNGDKFPTAPHNVELLPGRQEKLQQYQSQGYRLLGVSNQSGIQKGILTDVQAKACFEYTNHLLNLEIDYVYCPHSSFPISCYCRKPGSAFAAYFIEKYHLDPKQCLFVGDLKTDQTFAQRSGFVYYDQSKFF